MPTTFSQDRDLIVYEPALLRDVAWTGQRRLSTTGSISGSTLTINTGSFIDAAIEPGHTVTFDAVTLEIVAIDSPTTATVSLIRANASGTTLPPPNAENRPVEIHDFSPQRAIVHRQILAMLGITPDDEQEQPPAQPGTITESMITNPGALTRLECLATLHLIYAGASAPGRAAHFEQRVEMYLQRFRREREAVIAMIDTDADGIAETTRRPNAFTLTRH